MDKNNNGELSEEESGRFKTLLDQVHKMTVYNGKGLVEQKRLRESRR